MQPIGPFAQRAAGNNSDGCGWRRVQPAPAEPACGYVGNAKYVAHISTGAAPAEALKFTGCARQRRVAVAALAVSYGMPAHRETTPDDTLPLRRSVHHTPGARNKNEADRSRATKTGHVDELATPEDRQLDHQVPN